jgi:hypothetical protein
MGMTTERAQEVAIAALVSGMLVPGELDRFLTTTGFNAAAMWQDRKQQRVYLVAWLDYIRDRFHVLRELHSREGITPTQLRDARAVLDRILNNWDDRV